MARGQIWQNFPKLRRFMAPFPTALKIGKRIKPINIKNFGGTPPGVRPVCPGDTSHLSRDISRLSRGHSVPLVLIYSAHKSGPDVPGVPGTSRVCPWDASGASDRQIPLCDFSFSVFSLHKDDHVYLNSVQQMVSGEVAGEGLQTGFSRHGLPPKKAPLDTVYPLREHLNSVQGMVSGGYCEGLFPDTVCWTRLRIWCAGTTPILEKTLRECRGK